MDKINILVVDDEPEITELIRLILEQDYSINLSTAESGFSALEKVEANPNYDLIISDFNMPNGNGKFLFENLQRNQLHIPFVLLTSDDWADHPEFHREELVGYIQKPFDESVILQTVREHIKKIKPNGEDSLSNFISLTIFTLQNIGRINVPLYVKIGTDNFVKLYKENINFDSFEYLKLKNKNIDILYVARTDFKYLIHDYKKKALNSLLFKTLKADASEVFSSSIASQEVLKKAILAFGFSEEALQLAIESIQFVKAVADKNPDLNAMLRWINNNEYRFEYLHATLICYLTAEIYKRHQFQTLNSLDILALAAFFHDVSLEVYLIENETSFREAIKCDSKINKKDLENVRQHPLKSSAMLKEWTLCPSQVHTVIETHCELPDGKGFPKGLTAKNLDELSSCFILCEDIVCKFLQSRSKQATYDHFKQKENYYSTGYFLNFYRIINEFFSEQKRMI
jgi:response regulator RpfG family c-di-GMP phosphodiesterase